MKRYHSPDKKKDIKMIENIQRSITNQQTIIHALHFMYILIRTNTTQTKVTNFVIISEAWSP